MSVVEGRADIKICCVRSTSTGTRRVVRPSGWGVVNSLARRGCGPVGLVHTQKIGIQSEKPTWTKALEFTQFACPCGTDPRLLSGEQRTSHFKLVTSVDDPKRTSGQRNCPRLTAVNLCRLFGRTEPRAAEQDCRRHLGKSRFAPVRNVTRCGSRIAAFLWVGVDYLPSPRLRRPPEMHRR